MNADLGEGHEGAAKAIRALVDNTVTVMPTLAGVEPQPMFEDAFRPPGPQSVP